MSANLPQKQIVLSCTNDMQLKGEKIINVNDRDGVTFLPVLIRGSAGYISMLVTSKQENPFGFRKIEPKPSAVEETDAGAAETEIKDLKRKRKGGRAVRFLGSNATRRGVRMCAKCKGRIGYRSKMCKHCLKAPAAGKNTSSNGLMVKTLLQQKLVETAQVVSTFGSVDGKENELKEKEIVTDRLLLTNCSNVQICSSKSENKTLPSPSCAGETHGNNKLASVSQTLNDKEQDIGQNKTDLHYNEVTQLVKVPQPGSQEERNEDPQQMSLQDEHTDQGNIPGNLPQILKQENNDNLLLCLNPCSISKNNLLENGHLVSKSISDVFIKNTGGKDRKAMQISNKRKQKAYPSRKKKQRKVCPEVQFVRIEPKPCLKAEDGKDCSEDVDERTLVGNKLESVRFLPSNPTRRGVMPCPMCQKEVGCRSKTCRHCKVVINFSKSKALDNNNLFIVQLSPLTIPECVIFSVKKNITPSEERCFIRQAATKGDLVKDCKEGAESTCGFSWACECVEDDSFSQTPICEHAKCFYRNPKVVQARTVALTDQKIDCLPIDSLFKNKLKQLWEKNKTKELPLVQQVALNTLVVLDIEKDTSESSTDPITCVHIRFVKVKRHRFVQPHIFCSGKSCSYWSPLESQGETPVTCLHYCISLWAIASDNELQGYYKVFLEAPQVYLHSEVFETIVCS